MKATAFFFLLAAVAAVPLAGDRVPGAGLRVALVAMALPAVCGTLYLLKRRSLGPVSPALVAAWGFVAAAIVALPNADDAHGIDLTLTMIVGVACASVVALTCGVAEVATLLELFTIVSGVVCVISLTHVSSLSSQLGGSVVTGRLQGIFSQPNELGGFCALALPVALASSAYAETRLRRVVFGVCALLATVCLALSLSRGAWLGTTAAVIALGIMLPRVRSFLAGSVAVLIVGVATLFIVPAFESVSHVLASRIASFGGGASGPYDQRPLIWSNATRLIEQHPWFGVGPGGFATATGLPQSGLYSDPADHAHNIVLTAFAEQGILAVIALLGMAMALLALAIRVMTLGRRNPRLAVSTVRWTAAAPLAALTGIAVQGITDMPLRNPILNTAVWLIFGCAAASPLQRTAFDATEQATTKGLTV